MFLTRNKQLIMFVLVIGGIMTGCASKNIDKCYVTPIDYENMRNLFVETESIQRVEQEMEKRQWLECEREQIRYQLAKDFYLDELLVELDQ